MDTYFEKIAPSKLSPKTMYDRESVSRLFIVPLLGKKFLDRITTDDVRDLHDAIMNTPHDPDLRGTPPDELPEGTVMLSSSYARNAHNTLAAALSAAKAEQKIRVNVCDLVESPATGRAVDNALTKPEFLQLIQALQDDPHKALWLTFLLTGARRGEVAGLQIERISNGLLDFSWQLQSITNIEATRKKGYEYEHIAGKRYLVNPKTERSKRVLPMPDLLQDVLAEHIGNRTEGFVFLNRFEEPYDPSTIGRMWKDLLEKHDLPDHVTLHGARHTFVDMLYNAATSVREDTVMQLVGHSSRAMTRAYRTNVDHNHAQAAIGAIETLVIESADDDDVVDAEVIG
jgi:integrase